MRILAILILMPSFAFADSVKVEPWRVLSAVTGDWNDDANMDRAVLIEALTEDGRATDMSDLAIYFGNSDHTMEQVIYVEDIAWSGAMWGTKPIMDWVDNGSIEIHAMNDAIGRNRWESTLTITYIQGSFQVTEYTYISRDTLDLDNTLICNLNLLTGTGDIEVGAGDIKNIQHSLELMPMAEYSEGPLQSECYVDN